MRYLKANIDLTDNRDFNREGAVTVRGRLTGDRVVNNSGIRPANSIKTNDEFIKKLYTSDYVNDLIENMEKTCDRCGKYDYFNLMKTGLCHRCDELLDEECKVEYFPTGNKKLIDLKKKKISRRTEPKRMWWL